MEKINLKTDILEPEELKIESCKPYSDYGSSQTFATQNLSGMHSANFWYVEKFFRPTQLLRVQKSVRISECLLTVGRASGGEPEKFSDFYIGRHPPCRTDVTTHYGPLRANSNDRLLRTDTSWLCSKQFSL
jgi:hypothetical protein